MSKESKKIRRLNHLMGKNYIHMLYFHTWKKQTMDLLNMNVRLSSSLLEQIEIYQLAEELGIDDDELRKVWFKFWIKHDERKREYSKKPLKEGRDNKDVHVGGGGSNRNKVRYPSKKRSRRTWANFYKLFPFLAKEDGWDGKTSKKMK